MRAQLVVIASVAEELAPAAQKMKSLDRDAAVHAGRTSRLILAVEEHKRSGLGGAVAESWQTWVECHTCSDIARTMRRRQGGEHRRLLDQARAGGIGVAAARIVCIPRFAAGSAARQFRRRQP